MSEFKDKVVIITGASSGIGRGTALEYAKYGAKLVLAGRNMENLLKTAEQCKQLGLHKDKILLVQGDLAKAEACHRLIKEAVKEHGQIDILVNNAGSVVQGGIEQLAVEDLDKMYNIHVRSIFIITKSAVPYLARTKGAIVNISSTAGTRPIAYTMAYSIAKAAVEQFTGTLAQDLAPKSINVNCIAPGIIDTEIFTRPGGHVEHNPERLPEFLEKMGEIHPLGRVGNVQEVAATILFLTSKAASFITGASIPIDGGRHGTCSKAKL